MLLFCAPLERFPGNAFSAKGIFCLIKPRGPIKSLFLTGPGVHRALFLLLLALLLTSPSIPSLPQAHSFLKVQFLLFGEAFLANALLVQREFQDKVVSKPRPEGVPPSSLPMMALSCLKGWLERCGHSRAAWGTSRDQGNQGKEVFG